MLIRNTAGSTWPLSLWAILTSRHVTQSVTSKLACKFYHLTFGMDFFNKLLVSVNFSRIISSHDRYMFFLVILAVLRSRHFFGQLRLRLRLLMAKVPEPTPAPT